MTKSRLIHETFGTILVVPIKIRKRISNSEKKKDDEKERYGILQTYLE